MSPEVHEEWNFLEEERENTLPPVDYLGTIAEICYGEKYLWSKKDIVEYKQIFEDIC